MNGQGRRRESRIATNVSILQRLGASGLARLLGAAVVMALLFSWTAGWL
jgi:hypothetical protein